MTVGSAYSENCSHNRLWAFTTVLNSPTTPDRTSDNRPTSIRRQAAQGRSTINLPLNEFAQTRFAMYYENRDGYQRNFGLLDEDLDADDFGFRGHLRLLLHDRFELLTTYNYFEQGGVGSSVELQPLPVHAERTGLSLGPGGQFTSSAWVGRLCHLIYLPLGCGGARLWLEFTKSRAT